MPRQTSQTEPSSHGIPLHFGRYRDIAASLAGHLHSTLPATAVASGVHLLVPSRSAASGVARELLKLRPAGVAVIRFNTIELLAGRIVNAAGEFPPLVSDAQREILLKKAVEKAGHPLLAAHGIETMIGRSLRDLRDSGATIADVAGRLMGNARPVEERHEAFVAAARLYEGYLRSLRVIETHDLIGRAIHLVDEGTPVDPQILFGFYDMTGLQERLLSALRRRQLMSACYVPVPLGGDAEPLPPYAYAEPFVSKLRTGSFEPSSAVRPSDSCSTLTVRSLPSPREEMREICRSIRSLLDAGRPIAEIGIVSRAIDPAQQRLAMQFSREFGFEVAIPHERPLHAHRIGRSIRRALDISASRYGRDSVIEMLRDGFVTQAISGSPREIDRLDRLTRRYRIAGGKPEEADLAIKGAEKREGKPLPELSSYAEAVREIARVTETIPREAKGGFWSKLLATLGARFRLRTNEDIVAMEAIEQLGRELESLERTALMISSRDVAREIEKITIAVPEEKKPSVWFGDVMRMRGLSFTHLFCFAMQEDRLPQRRIPDPILTDRDRARVGLPLIGDGRSEEELLFQLMRDAVNEEGEFSYARADGFGKILRPSPFLPRLGIEENVESRTSEESSGAGPLSDRELSLREVAAAAPDLALTASLQRKLRLASSIGQRSGFDGYISFDDRMAEEMRRRLETVSPSWFEDFGDCPQKFLFRRLLGADELESPEHEPAINQRDKGGLDHRILERFYREVPEERMFGFDAEASSSLPPDLHASLQGIVREEFAAFDQENPPFNPRIRELEREITRANLERFIVGDLYEMKSSGFRPAFYEFTFGPGRSREPDHPDPVPIPLESIELRVRGTIDRIDRKGDLDYRIIDYKSGTASGYLGLGKKIDAGKKLQLALYALAAESIFEADPARVAGAIRAIGTDGRLKESHTFNLDDKRGLLIENLELFTSSILEGHFPALPEDDGACRYCTMKLTCRSRHDAEERRRMRRFASAAELLRETDDD